MWPFTKPRDSVFVIMHDSGRMPRTVTWYCGIPYIQTHSLVDDTNVKLLPGGEIGGKSYVKGWEPRTEAMLQYFKNISPAAGVSVSKEK